jgi:guanylate kinase
MKRIILVGKSASGKDHARKICQQWLGMHYAVSYTTRPPRDGEDDGVDYNFLSEQTFQEMIDRDEWYEYVVFNGWYYGTSREQMELSNAVFIMTPKGMAHLEPTDRKESLVIYFDIEEDLRKARMAERGGNADTVDRRIEADRIDFADYVDYDVKISKPYYTIKDVYDAASTKLSLPSINFFTETENFLPKW